LAATIFLSIVTGTGSQFPLKSTFSKLMIAEATFQSAALSEDNAIFLDGKK
jgi:hypothetical protein